MNINIQGKITRYEGVFKVLFIRADEYQSIYIPAHKILKDNGIEHFPIYGEYEKIEKLSPKPIEIYCSQKIDKDRLKQIYSGKITDINDVLKPVINAMTANSTSKTIEPVLTNSVNKNERQRTLSESNKSLLELMDKNSVPSIGEKSKIIISDAAFTIGNDNGEEMEKIQNNVKIILIIIAISLTIFFLLR